MDPNNTGNNNPIAGALTYPASSDDNPQPLPVQPRQPRNLQGLLRFAMEATKAEDAPGSSELRPLDEERRKFLEGFFKSLTVDIAQVLQNAIKVLMDTEKMQSIQLGEALPDDVKTSFNDILEYIDDMDVANDFYKLGGFAIFPICYGSENEEVRTRASSILGELCQNNPYCQARALDCGLLNVLLNLLQSERGDVLAKCIYAVSCATREYEPACRELTAQGGCETLAQLLRDSTPAARTKAAFLVRYLCHHYNDAKELFIKLNLVRTITEQIKSGRDDTTEHLLSILLSLVNDLNTIVLQQCSDPAINLKNTLEEHLKHPDLADDTYREEKEYCRELLKVLQRCPADVTEEAADR